MKIAVGGMIGVGKSTLTKKLGEHYGLPIMEEFEANDEVFNTLLTWLYEGKPNVEMLLQVYFLHTHWLRQKEMNDSCVIDRDIIEHWLFAQKNLAKYPKVWNMYNGLFHQYANDWRKPDLYIILDLSWDEFKRRIFARGRESEIKNYYANEDYFKSLISDYVELLKAQCVIYKIPYVVVNTDNMNEDEVFDKVKTIVDGRMVWKLK